MRMPVSPPVDPLPKLIDTPDRLYAVLKQVTLPTHGGRYLHWDKLRRIKPPEGLTHAEWWAGLKFRRAPLLKPVPLKDENGRSFFFGLPDPAPENLHHIDQGAGGRLELPELITNAQTRDRYIINSLMEEAIRSSQLEGAVTTRKIAKEMIRRLRSPRNKSERMILNNFRTMQRIQALKNERLTPELVFELHRIVTDQTLRDPSGAGRFRRADDPVHIADDYGEVYHVPPPAQQLDARLAAMCAFANAETPSAFVHPVVRSIILHFWLAYDHPFQDGNGRCARALFYWSMLRHGYWLCEYVSISQVILQAPIQYYRAFLYTETDDNDLTYFVLYHLKVMVKAVAELNEYLKRQTIRLQAVERRLRAYEDLNHRQRALISHALRHPDARYSIESHRSSHGVVYQTARSDLLQLADKGLLNSRKLGRTWFFFPVSNLEEQLAAANRESE